MSNKITTVMVLVAGFLIGLFFVHPLTMIIREFFHWHEGYWHLHWYEIPNALRNSYALQHVPMAIVYGILTAALTFFWAGSLAKYRQIAAQSQRFAAIGRESSTIVHDINNPLFGIRAFAELIEEGTVDAEKRDYCERIKSGADRISGLIAEIKTLAVGDGTVNVQKEPILLDEITRKVAKELHLSARLAFDPSTHCQIPIDPTYFSRVLSNLLKNADEVLRGKADAVIAVTLVSYANWLQIEISDNGPGIPPPIRKDLFKFGTTYGKPHGTGLGLYTTRRIVEAHGGEIYFKDRLGGGTTFIIKLPVA